MRNIEKKKFSNGKKRKKEKNKERELLLLSDEIVCIFYKYPMNYP